MITTVVVIFFASLCFALVCGRLAAASRYSDQIVRLRDERDKAWGAPLQQLRACLVPARMAMARSAALSERERGACAQLGIVIDEIDRMIAETEKRES